MSWVYPVALLISLAGVGTLDARYRLFLWRLPRRAVLVVALGFAFFVVWDLAGIALGLFRHLDSPYATGVMVAPHLPIEELVFLVFLSYLTMVLLFGCRRITAQVRSRRVERGVR
ncbi:lycopene cyclase domain-containing protein [Microbacterium sp. MC2]